MKTLFFPFLFFVTTLCSQPLKMHDEQIALEKGIRFNLKVPEGYHVRVAAEGLKRPRFFTKAPDGRLFITDMWDRSDNKKGRILILDGWNEKEKRFTKVQSYLDGLHNPNQIAFYSAGGKTFLYVAETGKLSYYNFKPGDTVPSSPPKIIATFPDYGLSYKYGGWHLTRSLAFHNNKLYVSIGSSCNACVEKEEIRATLVEMNPDGSNQRYYARGLRNSVVIKWVGTQLWATGMCRDGIGPDKPEDLFQSIQQGEYYGWPYYFQYKKAIYTDAHFKDSARSAFVKKPPVAPWGFKAHSAPLGFDYLTGFADALLDNSFLVALHGSTSVWRQRGNAVVQLLPNGTYREIVTGFLQGKTENKRYGRPCDVMQRDSRSFFVSDDKNGVIYFISKEE
ncbi:MAG: glucose/sorbosone dehydrogenase [Chitinophagaceae bacterium]|nr:MAG: glucose/sorbosone dehydrogenase [Chitinophagaceae bacterium]